MCDLSAVMSSPGRYQTGVAVNSRRLSGKFFSGVGGLPYERVGMLVVSLKVAQNSFLTISTLIL